jgi:tripartite-type tricarboxylate transporter receptor subunit TctC
LVASSKVNRIESKKYNTVRRVSNFHFGNASFLLSLLSCARKTAYLYSSMFNRTRRWMMKKAALFSKLLGVALFCAVQSTSSNADPVADFYTGKTLSFRVGFGPGGGYDITARIAARRLGAHIPGHPTVVVENMPGAGGVRLLNSLFNATVADGTVIGLATFESALEPLVGNAGAKFDPARFTWLGSLHTDISSCGVWKGAGQGIKTLKDLLLAKQPVLFGSTGPQTTISTWPLFMRNALRAPVKVVHGYNTTNDVMLAMARGEVHAVCGMFESSVRGPYAGQFASGDLSIFLQVGLDRKVPLFGGATQITEAVQGMGEEMSQIVRFVFGPAAIARPIVAPPGLPEDRTQALRAALLSTMRDPQVAEDGKKIGVDWDPVDGAEVQRQMLALASTPKEVLAKVSRLTREAE